MDRLPILIAVVILSLADAAWAAEPTAASTAAVATAPSDATASQVDAWLTDDGGGNGQAAEQTSAQGQGSAPRAIHGEASVGFGSNGYREADMSAVVPIGETGSLGVAVGDERFRGRERRDLALSLALGAGGSTEPCGMRHTGEQLAGDGARLVRCGSAPDPTAP